MTIAEYSPSESWAKLEEDPKALLVDVRTRAEWSFVGVPDLSTLNKNTILLEWKTYPNMETNHKFEKDLPEALGETEPSEILFLCRSGQRSYAAAQVMQGLFQAQARDIKCVNVAEGFEGDLDSEAHRGKMNGWKARGLAWRQS
ncbi:MAG: rhodanese-like domain-containing protein [Pseudomonadota bacterium]